MRLGLTATWAADEKPALKDQKEKISYGIGMSIGGSLKMQGTDLDWFRRLRAATKHELTAAGGISTREEIRELQRLGIHAVLFADSQENGVQDHEVGVLDYLHRS
jgi:uncharacterized protein related to proFAR isomerase